MENEIFFKSGYSINFYLSILICSVVLGFSLNSFSHDNLDISSLLITNLICCIAAFFWLRFDCRILIVSGKLHVRYLLPFNKNLTVEIKEIVEVDKHEDSIKRGYQKLFLKTKSGSYLINYNISWLSDESLINQLKKIQSENSGE